MGEYTNVWNFSNRSGDVKLDLDEVIYIGQANLKSNNIDFTGLVASEHRVGEIAGNLVNPSIPTSTFIPSFEDNPVPTSIPSGEVGRFSISERPGSNEVYRASGTFAGKTTDVKLLPVD